MNNLSITSYKTGHNQSLYTRIIRYVAGALLAIICFALASLPSLYISHLGAFPFDEPYQILNTLDYKNTPLAPLSSYLGSLFGFTFGWEWIKFRYLAFGLHKLAILIGCGYMWYKTRKYWSSLFITTALLFVSSIYYSTQNVYGWDSLTLPIVVCSIVAVVEYLVKNRTWLLIILGGLTALAGLCRIPNFVIVFFISAILLYPLTKGQSIKSNVSHIALYLVASIAFVLLLVCLLYGSPLNYVSYFKANRIEQHSIYEMIIPLMTSFFVFVQIPALLWCCYRVVDRTYCRSKCLAIVSSVVEIFVFYYFLRTYCGGEAYNNAMLFIIGLEVVMFLAIVKLENYDRKTICVLSSIFLLSCVPFVGSNVGFVKLVSLPVIPILYIYIRPHLTKTMIWFALLHFIGLLLYSVKVDIDSSFLDVGISNAKYEISKGVAKGIKTTESQGCIMDEIASDQENYREYNKIVLRDNVKYIYEYILLARNEYIRHIFRGGDDNDAKYVAWVENEIKNGGDKVAIWRFGDSNDASLMTSTLDRLCTKVKVWSFGDYYDPSLLSNALDEMRVDVTDRYTIYIKKTDRHE